jgi:hypothetical protein
MQGRPQVQPCASIFPWELPECNIYHAKVATFGCQIPKEGEIDGLKISHDSTVCLYKQLL